MNFLGLDPDALREQIEDLHTIVAAHQNELEIIDADLEGYSEESYAHFKEQVLKRRLDQLAHERSSMPLGHVELHAEYDGRYKEVQFLMQGLAERSRQRDEVEANLKESLSSLKRVMEQYNKAERKT